MITTNSVVAIYDMHEQAEVRSRFENQQILACCPWDAGRKARDILTETEHNTYTVHGETVLA